MRSWIRPSIVFACGALAAASATIAFGFYARVGNRVRDQVTAVTIQAVRPGMSLNQLTAQLGSPFQVRTKSPSDSSTYFLDYAEPGWLNEGYAITVETTSGEVVNVSVEYADMLIYRCDRTRCPQYVWRRDLLDALGR